MCFIKRGGLFLFFSNANFTKKTVGVCGIRTLIARVEGKHADHLTTTTAHNRNVFSQSFTSVNEMCTRCKIDINLVVIRNF